MSCFAVRAPTGFTHVKKMVPNNNFLGDYDKVLGSKNKVSAAITNSGEILTRFFESNFHIRFQFQLHLKVKNRTILQKLR